MIDLRRAEETDAQALAQLGKSTFIETFAPDNRPEDIAAYVAQTFGPARQLAEIRDPRRMIEIAWIDGQPAGFLHLRDGAPDPSVTGPRPLEILRFYVDSRWHGQGVAPAMMERAIRIAREKGFQTLWLGVWERNPRAQAFYAKHGFRTVGSHVFRLGDDEQTDHILVRDL